MTVDCNGWRVVKKRSWLPGTRTMYRIKEDSTGALGFMYWGGWSARFIMGLNEPAWTAAMVGGVAARDSLYRADN